MVWILVESHWICLQHSILVWSLFSSLLTLIGICLAWNHWLFSLIIITGVGLSILGIPASTTLQPRLLLSFIFLDIFDIIGKTYLTLDLIIWRRNLRTNCIDTRSPECDCKFDYCRMLLLDTTNGIIFLSISCVINFLLLISAIYLYIFIRKCLKSLLRRSQASKNREAVKQSSNRPDQEQESRHNHQEDRVQHRHNHLYPDTRPQYKHQVSLCSQASSTDSFNRAYGTFEASIQLEYSNESTL
ncbi:uncharacterized protein LOC112539451 [Tetranychus urticae]|uniref:Uncharacterized protein n=1 Tax=Tetranychus urticae TaxID=32264 RepID=T1KVS8_TETUR|nr:uncharacterized protein LOC112539451 [Tetranychus urticae]